MACISYVADELLDHHVNGAGNVHRSLDVRDESMRSEPYVRLHGYMDWS